MHLRCAFVVTQQAAVRFLHPLSDLDPDLVTKSTILKGFIYWPWQPMYGERTGFNSKATPRMCHLQHMVSLESVNQAGALQLTEAHL